MPNATSLLSRCPFPFGPGPGLSDVHLCSIPFPRQGPDLVPTLFCEDRVEVSLSDVSDLAKPEGQVCPRCESKETVRYGKPRGIQKYKCKRCRTYFTDLTGTVLHRIRLRAKWSEYLFLSPRSQRVYILFALDRFGNVTAELAPGESRVGVDELMRDRLAAVARVCVKRGIGYRPGSGKRSLGLRWTTCSRAGA
ncbi:MAG: hypothetical protein NUW23_03540 [Firmicutes bacterium]|nr:hypothetical protein [Bacillota bacterium]